MDKNIHAPNQAAYGDTIEALIGAVYLDRGFITCKKFVINRLLEPYINLDDIISSGQNSKSKLIEWAQKGNNDLKFDTVNQKDLTHGKEFVVNVLIDDTIKATGFGRTKKKAEQDAAK